MRGGNEPPLDLFPKKSPSLTTMQDLPVKAMKVCVCVGQRGGGMASVDLEEVNVLVGGEMKAEGGDAFE